MPLFSSRTAALAGSETALCPKLPAGQQYVQLPLPGAGPFVCPRPCGGQCSLQRGACAEPPAMAKTFYARLRLSETLVALVADALAHPCGCAAGGNGRVEGPAGEVALVGRRVYRRN